jgi:hypothetical protein
MSVEATLAVAVVSWGGALVAAAAQIVAGPETLVPVGVSLGCIAFLVAAAWKLRGYVEGIEARLRELEDHHTGEH